MVTDHKQSFRADEDLSVEERARIPWEDLWKAEEKRRAAMRREIFPDLPQWVNDARVRVVAVINVYQRRGNFRELQPGKEMQSAR